MKKSPTQTSHANCLIYLYYQLSSTKELQQIKLTPSTEIEEELIFGSSGVGNGGHVVKNYALDEHPQKHGCFSVLDQRVECLTKKRLKIKEFFRLKDPKFITSTQPCEIFLGFLSSKQQWSCGKEVCPR
jgi:hypothetical protein